MRGQAGELGTQLLAHSTQLDSGVGLQTWRLAWESSEIETQREGHCPLLCSGLVEHGRLEMRRASGTVLRGAQPGPLLRFSLDLCLGAFLQGTGQELRTASGDRGFGVCGLPWEGVPETPLLQPPAVGVEDVAPWS